MVLGHELQVRCSINAGVYRYDGSTIYLKETHANPCFISLKRTFGGTRQHHYYHLGTSTFRYFEPVLRTKGGVAGTTHTHVFADLIRVPIVLQKITVHPHRVCRSTNQRFFSGFFHWTWWSWFFRFLFLLLLLHHLFLLFSNR
jgi:hypothetical protein